MLRVRQVLSTTPFGGRNNKKHFRSGSHPTHPSPEILDEDERDHEQHIVPQTPGIYTLGAPDLSACRGIADEASRRGFTYRGPNNPFPLARNQGNAADDTDDARCDVPAQGAFSIKAQSMENIQPQWVCLLGTVRSAAGGGDVEAHSRS